MIISDEMFWLWVGTFIIIINYVAVSGSLLVMINSIGIMIVYYAGALKGVKSEKLRNGGTDR